MDFVLVLFPLSSLLLARSIVKKSCFEDKIDLPFRWSLSFWIIAAGALGIAGYDIYALNDQTTTTLFLTLCWLLGNGYVIANSFCNSYANAVYSLLLLIVSLSLYNKLHSLGKFLGRDMLLVLITWSSFILVMSILSCRKNHNSDKSIPISK